MTSSQFPSLTFWLTEPGGFAVCAAPTSGIGADEAASRRRGPEDLTLTLAQEFREARAWFARHKRDPFLWLVILGPLTFFAINMWGWFVFPPSGAVRAINQVLPNAEVDIGGHKTFPKCGGRTYLFGYDFHVPGIRPDIGGVFGGVCRDLVKGVWVVDIYPPYK